MKNLVHAAILTITLFQVSGFEPVRGELGRSADEKQKACVEACRAFIDQPGWELRSCIAKCQAPRRR